MKLISAARVLCVPLATVLAALFGSASHAQTTTSVVRQYDPASGNLISENTDGVIVSYSYDANGQLLSKVNERGVITQYGNYKLGVPQFEVHGAGTPEQIAISRQIDDRGCVISETNGEGYTTGYSRDGLCRLTSITPAKAGSSQTVIAYIPAAGISPETRTLTRGPYVEVRSYDGLGRLTLSVAAGIKRVWAYDVYDRKTFESYPVDASSTSITGDTLAYDLANRLKSRLHVDGSYSSFNYGFDSATGRPSVQSIDERGMSTWRTYRAFGKPHTEELMAISTQVPGTILTMTRNVRGQITSAAQGGFQRVFGYDSRFYLTAVSNPETGTTQYGRDSSGNMISRVVGSSNMVNFTYDAHNRLVGVTYPAGTPSISNTYNRIDRLLTAVSATGTRSYSYDPNGNLIAETLSNAAGSFPLVYGYTANDQIATLTYPISGTVVSYSPDSLGRPTMVSGFVSSVGYWPSGQIMSLQYANGVAMSYGQNARGWPSSLVAGKGASSYQSSAFSYDFTGNLISIVDSVDSSFNRTLGFDPINRLVAASGPWGNGSVAYDGLGNILNQSFGAYQLQYAYDGGNRLASISGGASSSYTYDAYGNVDTTPGTFHYDDVPSLRCARCNAPTRIDYEYDATGKRSSVTTGGIKTYEMYDSVGNLIFEYTPALSNKLVEYFYLAGKRIAQRGAP